ncbi:MAG: glutathione synthase [Pseudomonadota bacterium]
MSQRRLGVVMDPIAAIKPAKDTSLALLLAARRHGWAIEYLEPGDLALRDGVPEGRMRPLEVFDDERDWYRLGDARRAPLADLDVLLMRQDPPFDMEFVYSTYILERARDTGVLVVNDPASLRDANEKVFTAWFPEHCPATLIGRREDELRAFAAEHGPIILKPLDGMGGQGIFRLEREDPNLGVAIELLTDNGRRAVMAQQWLPAISEGDKRIILVDGEPVPWLLARMAAAGETRANLARGGRGVPRELDEAERRICAAVGPELRRRGLTFVGLDVIGDRITEINVTSPTGVRELDRECGLDIGGRLMETIEERLACTN